jgi:hypothetical protein
MQFFFLSSVNGIAGGWEGGKTRLGTKEKQEGSPVGNKGGRMEQLEDWKNGSEGEKEGPKA